MMMMMMNTALAAFASHRGAFGPCTPTPELILARKKAWAPDHFCGSPFLTPYKQFSREIGRVPDSTLRGSVGAYSRRSTASTDPIR